MDLYLLSFPVHAIREIRPRLVVGSAIELNPQQPAGGELPPPSALSLGRPTRSVESTPR
ncbi:MAG: hypothetical protein JOY68_08545 [Candidatus Dormibacteraeota bacterium]|nr:hypothetical protein [Candidatus Dormibacteraeota bacterium]